MALSEEFTQQGQWLFRWRSYLPLICLPLIVVAIVQANGSFATPWHEISEYLGFGISVVGLVVRILTVGHTPAGTSGRNSRHQIANELNTTGMYSIVRHPLYLGNYLIGLGISTVLLVWWLPVMYSLLFCLYYERIMFTEEAFLREKFGEEFTRAGLLKHRPLCRAFRSGKNLICRSHGSTSCAVNTVACPLSFSATAASNAASYCCRNIASCGKPSGPPYYSAAWLLTSRCVI